MNYKNYSRERIAQTVNLCFLCLVIFYGLTLFLSDCRENNLCVGAGGMSHLIGAFIGMSIWVLPNYFLLRLIKNSKSKPTFNMALSLNFIGLAIVAAIILSNAFGYDLKIFPIILLTPVWLFNLAYLKESYKNLIQD